MFSKIIKDYGNTLLESFNESDSGFFKYIVESVPEVMLAYRDSNGQLQLNRDYIALLALLVVALGPSRELIMNTKHARSLSELYEVISNDDLFASRIGKPSLKLLQLLVSDTWPQLATLFTDDESTKALLIENGDLTEAIVPMLKARGTENSFVTVLKRYIKHTVFSESSPMTGTVQVNDEEDFYGNKQLYDMLLWMKPIGYLLDINSRQLPLLTASTKVIADKPYIFKQWVKNMSRYVRPYPGDAFEKPVIDSTTTDGKTLEVKFFSKIYEKYTATLEATIRYDTYGTTEILTATKDFLNIDPSSNLKQQTISLDNSVPAIGAVISVKVKLNPYNYETTHNTRQSEASLDVTGQYLHLQGSTYSIASVVLDEFAFVADVSITNTILEPITCTIGVSNSSKYTVQETIAEGETKTLRLTHNLLYSKQKLTIVTTRSSRPGEEEQQVVDLKAYIPENPAELPRLEMAAPIMSYSWLSLMPPSLGVYVHNKERSLPSMTYIGLVLRAYQTADRNGRYEVSYNSGDLIELGEIAPDSSDGISLPYHALTVYNGYGYYRLLTTVYHDCAVLDGSNQPIKSSREYTAENAQRFEYDFYF